MNARLVFVMLCGMAVGVALPRSTSAQVTTASIRGSVLNADDGTPMMAATVTLEQPDTGVSKSVIVNDDGAFAFTGLAVGGPYQLRAEMDGFKSAEVKGIMLSAGKTASFELKLALQSEVIEVHGAAVARNSSNKTVITAEEIESLPSVSRDPRDLVRRTPEASVEGSSHTLSINGMNTRFNSITVDGIREDDDFGLNSSGYPTKRSPIAMSVIQEMTVESAPFDVHYSKFMGGNVNIITKSGSNDFHGSLFATISDDKLMGTRTGPNTLINNKFSEFRYGATLAGPIVEDSVHFIASVEGLSATTPVSSGPAGSGAANITGKVSQDDMAMAQQIAQSVYNYNAGVPSRNLGEANLNIFSKVDWQINNQHRFTAMYQRTSDNQDTNSSSSNSTLSLSSNWYDEDDTLNAYAFRLFSDWSSQLSTQVEVNGKYVSARPTPLNGNGFMAASIRTAGGGTILLGPDDFRQTNFLDNDLFHVKAEANYLQGSHLLTGGLEYEQLHINNDFIADTTGGATYASLADFAAMKPMQITYSNATTLNPQDGAALWNSGTIAAFVQDQWKFDESLTVQAGLRLETYLSGDKIAVNQHFIDRYGFANTATLNGRSILMPRLGMSYLVNEDLNLRAGGGLYSGGSPTVWVSNAYSNDGVRIGTVTTSNAMLIDGFDGRHVSQGIRDLIAAGNGNTDAIDPNFKLPSAWKVGTGADWEFMKQGMVKLSYTFTKIAEGVNWEDLRRNYSGLPYNEPVGTTPDGRPLYDVTNFNVHRGYDMLLTNTKQGYGHVITGTVEKTLPYGLFVSGTYAWQHVLEVNPANSSRSVSNYDNVALFNPQYPGDAPSAYQRTHHFTAALEWKRALFDDGVQGSIWSRMKTSIGIFAEARSGQPYSWTFGDSTFGSTLGKIFGEESTFASHDRELFYVPKGDGSDVILNGIDPTLFQKFLDQTGLSKYKGQIAPRNAFESPWYKRVDMRLSQDVPNPFHGQRGKIMIDIQNVGNLIDHKWGRSTSVGFPYGAPAVDVSIDQATGKYVYSNLRPPDPSLVDVIASVWRISIGAMYDF